MSSSPRPDRKSEGTNLYVSNLSYSTDEADLEAAFKQYGTVLNTKIIKDPNSKRSRGFGFVTFADAREAERAIDKMNDSEIDDRKIRVEKARDSKGPRRTGGNSSRGSGRRSPQRYNRRDEYRDRSPKRRSPHRRSRSPY